MKKVFILHHVHELHDMEEDAKLIGVYDTRIGAELAIERARLRPGFKNFPDGFVIGEYLLGEDHWIEGFVTLVPE